MERELYPNIEPHESHAQLLVQTDPSSSQFETAKQIIESIGIRILEIDQVSPAWMLLKLNTPDMREIALRLSQMGFFNFRGINALSLKG